MKRRKTRCWKGYKPVKGKRPYSKGSCRKVRRNKMRGTNIRVRVSRPSYGKPFYGDVISVYRRTPGKVHDEGVYSSHHGRVDKGYLIQRSPNSGATWYTREDFRLAKRRGLRRNKMRTRNSMGQKLYVVITADGTPLSGRIGTLEPPGPIFYTKGEAIKKGRMFRGRVVSAENYYKMGRGLRRNPETTKARPIPGMFYSIWFSGRGGQTAKLVVKGEILKKASISNLSRMFPYFEMNKLQKLHTAGPYSSFDEAFLNR